MMETNSCFILFKQPEKATQFHVGECLQFSSLTAFEQAKIDAGVIFHPFQVQEDCPILVFTSPNSYSPEFDAGLIEQTCIENASKPQPITEKSIYVEGGKKVLSLFNNNTLRKLVYSRIVSHKRNSNQSIRAVFDALCAKYPQAFVYVMSHPKTGNWIAATPETLLSQKNSKATTMALASTRPLNSTTPWGEKEIEEQEIVATFIANTLKASNIASFKQSNPFTKQAGNIEHICSTFEFQLSDNEVYKLINGLHPTPAVSGLPKQESLDYIKTIEQHNRLYYAGFVGPFNAMKQEMNLYVNLRCATFNQEKAQAYVGGGWTKLSNAEKEWEETEIKSKTICSLL